MKNILGTSNNRVRLWGVQNDNKKWTVQGKIVEHGRMGVKIHQNLLDAIYGRSPLGLCRSIIEPRQKFSTKLELRDFARSWFDKKGLHNVVSNKNVIKNSRHWCMRLAPLNRGKLSLHFMRFCFVFEIKKIAHHKTQKEWGRHSFLNRISSNSCLWY